MDLEKLRIADIDVEDGLHRFMSNEQMFVKYLKKFIDNDQYQALKMEIDRNPIDVKEAFERAHALKGICANLSMAGILTVLNPMVESLRAGSVEGVKENMIKLSAQYDKVITVLKQL